MNYPLISEYIDAIKASEDNLEQLKNLRPVLDEDGEPVMSSGNFAVVFKMRDDETGKVYAVKCFLKEQEGRAEAYRLIADELKDVSSPYLTSIQYFDKELFVDTNQCTETEFPVLLMDWVEGKTLDKYICEYLDDKYELELLAYRFSQLAQWLMPRPFAHGDLKPDNILVKDDGELVLVDYDGMYVPSMKGQKSWELGSPDFRHPSRTEKDFDEHIDDFSLASILLSLKAISLQPDLLEQYGATDRLLFSEADYRNIPESRVLDALKLLMQDPELASLYSLFILAVSQNNLSQVSFRLFNLSRPERPQYEEENLSTRHTKEDWDNAWTDEFGVKYSADRRKLLRAPHKKGVYIIRKETKVIDDFAFYGCDFTHIFLHNGISAIGRNAFDACTGHTSIFIPNSVISIGDDAFSGCRNLTRIIVESENPIYDSRDNCNAIIKTSNNQLIVGTEKTVIPSSVTSIGDNAFEHCSSLRSIYIPKGVTSNGNFAFPHKATIFIPEDSLTKFEKLIPYHYEYKLVENHYHDSN